MASGSALSNDQVDAARTAPEWVVFACEGHWFAVPMRSVTEIIVAQPVTRLPGCGPEVCGLAGLRGRVVTVFDMGAALGLRPAADWPDHRLLLLEHDSRRVAMAVEEIVGIARSDASELPLTGEALSALDVRREDLLGIGALNERAFVAVDPGALLDRLLA